MITALDIVATFGTQDHGDGYQNERKQGGISWDPWDRQDTFITFISKDGIRTWPIWADLLTWSSLPDIRSNFPWHFGPYLSDSKLLLLSYYWFLHAHHLRTWQSNQTHKPHTFPHILFMFSLWDGSFPHGVFLKFTFSLWILMLIPLLPHCLAPKGQAESAWFLVPCKARHMSWLEQTHQKRKKFSQNEANPWGTLLNHNSLKSSEFG